MPLLSTNTLERLRCHQLASGPTISIDPKAIRQVMKTAQLVFTECTRSILDDHIAAIDQSRSWTRSNEHFSSAILHAISHDIFVSDLSNPIRYKGSNSKISHRIYDSDDSHIFGCDCQLEARIITTDTQDSNHAPNECLGLGIDRSF